LQHLSGNLSQSHTDGESVKRLKGKDFQQQQVQRSLKQIRRFAHRLFSVTYYIGNRAEELDGIVSSGLALGKNIFSRSLVLTPRSDGHSFDVLVPADGKRHSAPGRCSL
jgi:hypothetical protein